MAEQSTTQNQLTKVASFKGVQVTGVTMSPLGRLFACFPRWREGVPFSVVEVRQDGSYVPYPDESWNHWLGAPQDNKFTCVQAVWAQDNSLFVLDPANPEMKGVVGNPALYEFDLNTDLLKNKWIFDRKIAPEQSYLNDLRIDEEFGRIYITESGTGAIILLDIVSGVPRRLLDKHPSVKAEDIYLTVEGEKWLRDGKQPQMHADGIALSPDKAFLYYHALTGYHLYRVSTDMLTSEVMDEEKLEEQVEDLGKTPAPDGMIFDQNGNLYMADLEKNAIVYRTPEGDIRTLIQDEQIKWADTFTLDGLGNLLFTTSRLHEAVGDISDIEFCIYKVPLAEPVA
ncbi:SMP-30/gluconolactonase/LRE family protein [Telluribacter sp.]|jgi:sugar lactone lactonase YvrE|uniref:SMP-30/gluconolactonase/LRE family protein n=1 Tax=Telluribacter sp. TaxID=1978767 RepID=UPI002E15CFF3|nr:L-dopachrome tautomerase-related protein [Telluribacter sp.]